jgi:hypothetical protein
MRMQKIPKTWKPIVILVLFAVACGGTAQRETASATREKEAESVQCSLSLAPHSDAAAIQRAVQAVTDGSLDPCAGALPQRELYAAQLARIDEGDGADPFLVLVFWMRLLHPLQPSPLRP